MLIKTFQNILLQQTGIYHDVFDLILFYLISFQKILYKNYVFLILIEYYSETGLNET